VRLRYRSYASWICEGALCDDGNGVLLCMRGLVVLTAEVLGWPAVLYRIVQLMRFLFYIPPRITDRAKKASWI
jgi:hypothetical protein